ncbi:hypothetical protein QY97_03188 [Bacillus thermotolerans]|nr:hypothetical protein QY97_03188 [Bacillus thermotolerans]
MIDVFLTYFLLLLFKMIVNDESHFRMTYEFLNIKDFFYEDILLHELSVTG